MRYAKLINEREIKELNPAYIEVDGLIHTNPLNNSNVDLEALGYKEFVIDNMPNYDQNTQVVERYYQETNGVIHRSWRVRDLTAEEIAEREKEME